MTPKQKSIFHYVTAPAPRYMLRISVLDKLFKKYLNNSNLSFVEIGPGLGDLSNYLIEHARVSEGCAVEASNKAIMGLKDRFEHYDEFKLFKGDFSQTCFENKNIICAFEVLEHIEDDIPFLKKINQSLVKGGLLFLSVPAYKRKWQRQDEWAGHVRRYEKEELKEKLSRAGFEVKEMIDYGFPLMTLLSPIKQLYYKKGDDKGVVEKTHNSGIDRPIFGNKNPWLFYIIYAPFILMQKLFYGSERGDGLIVVAKKA